MGSRLKWAGHMKRMERDRLTKRINVLRVEDGRRRERPRLRWEDCEERFGGSGRGGENESEGWGERRRRDGSETGLVAKKKGKRKVTTGIGALDYKDKEESGNSVCNLW